MNVIVIVADSFRKDHLGCYGNDWISTPNLDAFAARSCVIDGAYADSLNTAPCRTSMMLGRVNFPHRPWQPFERDDLPVAEWLWDKGVTSAFITDGYHLHKHGHNFDRGFDERVFIRGQEYDPWVLPAQVDERAIEEAFRRHFKPSEGSASSDRTAANFRYICGTSPAAGARRTTSARRSASGRSTGWRGTAAGRTSSSGWTSSTRTSRGTHRLSLRSSTIRAITGRRSSTRSPRRSGAT